jgi:MFS family permease
MLAFAPRGRYTLEYRARDLPGPAFPRGAMHAEVPPPLPAGKDGRPWWYELNRYHWFVLVVCALGWLFDTFDQQLFVLARKPAMTELLRLDPADPQRNATEDYYGTLSTAFFLVGWATGGIAFGLLGDRIGRVKTMILTILAYSFFTGFSALSQGFLDFAAYRFLTGLGVGGEFAVGVALVAEVMPDRARPFALGLLQALSAVGNMTAALVNMGLGQLESAEAFGDFTVFGSRVHAWRLMFVIGTLPALLVVVIMRRLKEPERWKAAAGVAQGALGAPATPVAPDVPEAPGAPLPAGGSGDHPQKQLGSLGELFGDPRWRRNALVGLLLAASGVIGLWGIGFCYPELLRTVFNAHFDALGMTPDQKEGSFKIWTGVASLLTNFGAFFGIYAFSYVTHYTGRKPAFAVSFLIALGATALVFWRLSQFSDIFWMLPLMGFCQLSLFGGYAIYLPELFPTRLRSTGTSFCYNVGRLVAAVGPFTFGSLIKLFADAGQAPPWPHRYAGLIMCSIFLLGLVALPFAPETKGKPLPE